MQTDRLLPTAKLLASCRRRLEAAERPSAPRLGPEFGHWTSLCPTGGLGHVLQKQAIWAALGGRPRPGPLLPPRWPQSPVRPSEPPLPAAESPAGCQLLLDKIAGEVNPEWYSRYG